MKKLLVLLLVLVVLVVGCKKEEKTLTIGINQLIEHASLDAVREGFMDEMKAKDVKVEFLEKNAQGEVSMATTIASGFVDDKVDLILAIATPSAQASANVTEEIPIVFSAVTDPLGSDLVKDLEKPGGNVTGTSDAMDIKGQLELFQKLNPEIKTIGILYNTGETNSVVQVEQSQALGQELGLQVEAVGVNAIGEVPQALEKLLPQIDGMYIITDNMVASSMQLITDRLLEEKIPSVCAFGAGVNEGALITYGFSYYDLGKQTADMAIAILKEGKEPKDMPVEYAKAKSITYNATLLKALGLSEDLEILKDAEVVE